MATAKKSAATKPAAKKSAAKSAVASKAPAAKSVSAKKAPSAPVAKKAAGKTAVKAAKSTTPRAPNAAFMKPLTPSDTLAAVVGAAPLPRTEVTKKVWEYIKKNNLQDAANKRNINADDKLKEVFGGKKQVSMFEMTKLISGHLK